MFPESDLVPAILVETTWFCRGKLPWKAGDGRRVDEFARMALLNERNQSACLPVESKGSTLVADLDHGGS